MKLQNEIDRLGCWTRKLGYEIPTRQMQHDAADIELDKKFNAELPFFKMFIKLDT